MGTKFSIKFKDTYEAQIISVMNDLANKPLFLTEDLPAESSSNVEFSFPAQGGDSLKDWGSKMLITLVTAMTKMALKKDDIPRYDSDISAVPPPDHGIIEDVAETDNK